MYADDEEVFISRLSDSSLLVRLLSRLLVFSVTFAAAAAIRAWCIKKRFCKFLNSIIFRLLDVSFFLKLILIHQEIFYF